MSSPIHEYNTRFKAKLMRTRKASVESEAIKIPDQLAPERPPRGLKKGIPPMNRVSNILSSVRHKIANAGTTAQAPEDTKPSSGRELRAMMLGRDRRTAAAQYQQQQQNDSLGRPVAKERSKYLPQSGKDVRMQRFGPFMSARSHQNQKNIRSDQKQSSQPRKTHSIEPSQPHMISPGGSYAQSIPIQQRFPGSSLGLTGPSAPATGHYPRSPSSEPNGNTSSDTYCSASLASTYESIEHTHEYAPLSRTLSWSSSSTRYHHQEIRELTPIATTASSCRGTSYSFSASSLSPESYDSPRLEKLSDRHYYEQQSHQQQQQMGQGIERRRQRNDAESLGFDGDARVYKRARYEPVHEQVPVDTHHGSISTAASLIPPSKDSNRRLPSLAWCQQRLWAPLSNPISHHSDNDTGGDDVVPFEDASFTTTPSLTTSPTSDEWELNRLVNENSRLKSYILRVYGEEVAKEADAVVAMLLY